MRTSDRQQAPSLRALADAIDLCMARHTHGRAPPAATTGLFGGALRAGCIHEWFAAGGDADQRCTRRRWSPPLAVMLTIATSVAAAPDNAGKLCVWIGRRCWPHPVAAARASPALLHRSLFVSPGCIDDRLWTVDLALRSSAAALVAADAAGLSLNDTRRLQLAAEAGGSLGLLVRPPWERRESSAARTRWLVSPALSSDSDQRWTVELLRCKGVQPASREARQWCVRRCHATGDVGVVPDASDRSIPAAAPAAERLAV